MSNATHALESAIGSALFLSQPLVTPTQWTVHLYVVAPNEDGTGGTEITAGANGYQPVRHDPGADRWVKVGTQDGSGNTLFRNSTNVALMQAIPITSPTITDQPKLPFPKSAATDASVHRQRATKIAV